jgi:hypothetical protein
MHRTRVESIDLVSTDVAGQRRYLSISTQMTLNEDPPIMDRPVCVFRNVLSVNGQKQPWLWQDRPYFATAAGELLVFRDTPTYCVGCGKKGLVYGYRDGRNRLFCFRCPVESPVPPLPSDPLIFRDGDKEVILCGIPTAVWPDQFPVSRFRERIKRNCETSEQPIEEDGSDLAGLFGPSWFG